MLTCGDLCAAAVSAPHSGYGQQQSRIQRIVVSVIARRLSKLNHEAHHVQHAIHVRLCCCCDWMPFVLYNHSSGTAAVRSACIACSAGVQIIRAVPTK